MNLSCLCTSLWGHWCMFTSMCDYHRGNFIVNISLLRCFICLALKHYSLNSWGNIFKYPISSENWITHLIWFLQSMKRSFSHCLGCVGAEKLGQPADLRASRTKISHHCFNSVFSNSRQRANHTEPGSGSAGHLFLLKLSVFLPTVTYVCCSGWETLVKQRLDTNCWLHW